MANYFYVGPEGASPAAVEPENLLKHGVTEETLVWCDGMADWAKAGEIEELKPLFQKPAPGNGSKVTVYGYTEPFAMNPDVKVLLNGVEIASVARNASQEIVITEPCKLEFKCSFRSAKCEVKPGDVVVLSFNRTTGSLNATLTNTENVESEISQKKESDSTRIIWIAIICFVLLALSQAL